MIHTQDVKELVSPFLDKPIREFKLCCPLKYFATTRLNQILLNKGYELAHPEGMYFLRSRGDFVYLKRNEEAYMINILTTLDSSNLEILFANAFVEEYKGKYVAIHGLSMNIECSFKVPAFDSIKHTLPQSIVSVLDNTIWNFEEFCNRYSNNYISNTVGILVYAPPGYGKTFILRSYFNKLLLEKNFTVVQVYQRSIINLNLAELLSSCKSLYPCILFIEDIDIKFEDRREGIHPSIAGDLLETLEGLNQAEKVVIIATSNYVDGIEKALLRPGRFDYLIEIEKPSKAAKEEVLCKYLEGFDFGLPKYLKDEIIESSETFAELNGSFKHLVKTYLSTGEFPSHEEINSVIKQWKETRIKGVTTVESRKVGLI